MSKEPKLIHPDYLQASIWIAASSTGLAVLFMMAGIVFDSDGATFASAALFMFSMLALAIHLSMALFNAIVSGQDEEDDDWG